MLTPYVLFPGCAGRRKPRLFSACSGAWGDAPHIFRWLLPFLGKRATPVSCSKRCPASTMDEIGFLGKQSTANTERNECKLQLVGCVGSTLRSSGAKPCSVSKLTGLPFLKWCFEGSGHPYRGSFSIFCHAWCSQHLGVKSISSPRTLWHYPPPFWLQGEGQAQQKEDLHLGIFS